MKVAMITRIGLLLAFSQGSPGWAATIVDVNRTAATIPKAAGPPVVLMQSGDAPHLIRLDYLRTPADVRRLFGGISNTTASLALILEIPTAGQNVTRVGGGMLDLAGSDTGKAAALLGKMHGQFQMNHTPTVSVLGNDTVSIGRRGGRQARAVADDAGAALGLMGTSFVREAKKKFFPDPIIGIRG